MQVQKLEDLQVVFKYLLEVEGTVRVESTHGGFLSTKAHLELLNRAAIERWQERWELLCKTSSRGTHGLSAD